MTETTGKLPFPPPLLEREGASRLSPPINTRPPPTSLLSLSLSAPKSPPRRRLPPGRFQAPLGGSPAPALGITSPPPSGKFLLPRSVPMLSWKLCHVAHLALVDLAAQNWLSGSCKFPFVICAYSLSSPPPHATATAVAPTGNLFRSMRGTVSEEPPKASFLIEPPTRRP